MATDAAEILPGINHHKRSVRLKSGIEIKENDHVYVSPSWSARDGTPYSIGRIMEFLKPEGSFAHPEYDTLPYTRVRLAWYYRPRDVSDRPGGDSRLLLAAIYSEVCDINQVRDKCFVVHRDKISDLSGWKKRPDRFYFMRLFDPYLKKEFEIIQATDVKNIPENVREKLTERYEYVAAEKEVVPDLTDALRSCDTCTDWCPSLESVQCDRCKKYFHMRCVQPPLQAKPSRGYGWTCAPCSRRHEEEVGSRDIVRHEVSNNNVIRPPKSNAPAPRGRGRPRKDRSQAEKEENFPVKHFRMWPFRYFGQYTHVEDTLHPEDLIFPRDPTRIGPKYQLSTFPEVGSSHMGLDEERGGDKTVEVLGAVNDFTPAEMTEMEECLRNITSHEKTQHSVDFLTEVVRQFSEATLNGKSLSSVTWKTINAPRIEKWKPQPTRHYTDRDWSKDEIFAFEDAIAAHGAELRAVRDEVVVRSIYEVVRFYGHWKNMKLGEENARIRKNGHTPALDLSRYTSSEPDSNNVQTIGLSDEESSVIVPPSKAPACGACRTRDSRVWWKAPKGLQSNILCDSCGINYRKYADLNMRQTREDSGSVGPGTKTRPSSTTNGGEKREGTPLAGPSAKRSKTASSVPSTPPPPSNVPQIRCCACSKDGPIGKVIKCKKCGFSVHAASIGVTLSADKLDDWLCDLCENEMEQEASVYHDCLLCPRPRGAIQSSQSVSSSSSSYLRACKVTESHGWAHVLCATFIPEINFTDTSTMRSVEGITNVPQKRWTPVCTLCQQKGGAVVRCNDCSREYHVSCAWTHGHSFGFEIQPVKGTRRDNHITTTFKGETGSMNAIISCKEHGRSRRQIYEICETDDGGETALQVYCRTYKQVPQVSQTHALLRKARRLDQLVAVHPDSPGPDPVIENLDCLKCHTQFTPRFYKAEAGWLCHRCHFTPPPPKPQFPVNAMATSAVVGNTNGAIGTTSINESKSRSPTMEVDMMEGRDAPVAAAAVAAGETIRVV